MIAVRARSLVALLIAFSLAGCAGPLEPGETFTVRLESPRVTKPAFHNATGHRVPDTFTAWVPIRIPTNARAITAVRVHAYASSDGGFFGAEIEFDTINGARVLPLDAGGGRVNLVAAASGTNRWVTIESTRDTVGLVSMRTVLSLWLRHGITDTRIRWVEVDFIG